MRAPDALAALREREFRLLFLGQGISLLGDRLTPVALAFAVLDLTGSASDLGFVLAAGWAPQLVLLLVGGVVSDRVSRRAVMLAADATRAVSQGTLAALLLSGSARLWQLLVLQAAAGAASAFFGPASTGLVPQTVSPERLHGANALRGISMWSAQIVGPAVAGVLVATVGPGYAIAVDAASFAASAAFLAALRLPVLGRRLESPGMLRELAEGWREFRSRTWLWSIVVGRALPTPSSARRSRSSGRSSRGGSSALVVALAGAGAVLGAALVLAWRPRRPLLVGVLVYLAAVPRLAFLAAGLPLAPVAAASVPAGAEAAIFGALWETTLQRNVPQESLSRVSAYDWLGSIAFIPVASVAVGPLAAAIGAHATIWGSCAFTALMTLGLASVRSIRDLRG